MAKAVAMSGPIRLRARTQQEIAPRKPGRLSAWLIYLPKRSVDVDSTI